MTLVQAGVSQVDDLSRELDVSASTIRRDLSTLMREARIERTYGGAVARSVFQERSIGASRHLQREAKALIASYAARLIEDSTTIFVDAGTTCLALAEQIFARRGLTVMTRGLEIASALAAAEGLTVMIVGGTVRPLSHGIVGPLSNLTLDRFTFDAAFLGADAVHPELGLGEPTIEETMIKEAVALSSARVYVVADSTKIAAGRPPAWSKLNGRWTLITDRGISAHDRQSFVAHGVGVVLANADELA